jgi:hypothetical protein
MNRILFNTNIQPVIIAGVGNLPTIPSPTTLRPDQSGWLATDIMVGEIAYNPDDDIYYYRNNSDEIIILAWGKKYIDLEETTEPDTPAANKMRLYVEAVNGFSFFSFKDDTGMVRKLVRDSVIVGYNDTVATIPENRAVYASGSFNDVPTIARAQANDAATMPCIGVTLESIAVGAYGRVMQVGLIENINTLSFEAGDVLYVSEASAGIVQTTLPVHPNISQEIGTILVKDAAVGAIQIVARTSNRFGVLHTLATAENDFLIASGNGTFVKKTLAETKAILGI